MTSTLSDRIADAVIVALAMDAASLSVLDRLRADELLAERIPQAADQVRESIRPEFAEMLWNMLGYAYCLGNEDGTKAARTTVDEIAARIMARRA